MKELEAISNVGKFIKIGDKEYRIQSPSLGVVQLVMQKMNNILEKLQLTKEDFENKDLSKLLEHIIQKIYYVLVGKEGAQEIVDELLDIIIMFLENKPIDKCTLNRETLKWEISLEELLPVIIELFKLTDVSDFLLLMLKLAQTLDLGLLRANSDESQK